MKTGAIYLMVGALLMTLDGCALMRKVHVKSRSPDGSIEVTVWDIPHPPDSSIQITIKRANRWFEKTIYRDTDDRAPNLTEVYWTADSTKVGVLICSTYVKPVRFGYDSAA